MSLRSPDNFPGYGKWKSALSMAKLLPSSLFRYKTCNFDTSPYLLSHHLRRYSSQSQALLHYGIFVIFFCINSIRLYRCRSVSLPDRHPMLQLSELLRTGDRSHFTAYPIDVSYDRGGLPSAKSLISSSSASSTQAFWLRHRCLPVR